MKKPCFAKWKRCVPGITWQGMRHALKAMVLAGGIAAAVSGATHASESTVRARNTAPATLTTRNADIEGTHRAVADRVITLAPHLTEMVFAAGAGDKVVATVSSSNYPPQALSIPRVGDGLTINAEHLLALEPDLIVGWQQTLALEQLTPLLNSLSIPVVYAEPRKLDDIPDSIEKIGAALGTPEPAARKAAELRQQLAALRKRHAHQSPVTVFIEVGTGPLYTLGSDTLTNDAIASCGGVNIFADSPLVAPAVAVESVLARNPDVVITTHSTAERLTERAQYWHDLHLEAAHRGHIYDIHPDMLVRPGPRLIQATARLCDYIEQARSGMSPRSF